LLEKVSGQIANKKVVCWLCLHFDKIW